MSHGNRAGSSIAPIFLRLGLGITFIWAGLGKVLPTFSVQGEDALILANLGVITSAPPRTTPAPQPAGTPTPTKEPKVEPPPAPSHPLPDPDAKKPADSKPGDKPAEKPAEPPAEKPKRSPLTLDADTSASIILTQTAPRFTAADFSEPVKVRRVHAVTLLVHKAAHPAPTPEGKPVSPIWPTWAGGDRWPVLLAWAAAITELVGGVMVLVGLLTRFWALALAGTIVVACWLTVIGPALQSGNSTLFVLPNKDWHSVADWQTPLWQLMLAMSGLALLFAGPGSFSLDRALFGKAPPAAGALPVTT